MVTNELILPNKFKGKCLSKSKYIKSTPRKWTPKEIEWTSMLIDKGLKNNEIAICLDREIAQVSNKVRRILKKQMRYNEKHYDDKLEANKEFLEIIKPKSILDVFAGRVSIYEELGFKTVSNDKNPLASTNYHMDALDFMCKMYLKKEKFDLIDLDPFGSAYDCFDLAIKLSSKALVITLGELGHKRFKRLDYVSRYYGINEYKDFNTCNLINHIIEIGKRNKKALVPIIIKDWNNIARVYFKIEKTPAIYRGYKD